MGICIVHGLVPKTNGRVYNAAVISVKLLEVDIGRIGIPNQIPATVGCRTGNFCLNYAIVWFIFEFGRYRSPFRRLRIHICNCWIFHGKPFSFNRIVISCSVNKIIRRFIELKSKSGISSVSSKDGFHILVFYRRSIETVFFRAVSTICILTWMYGTLYGDIPRIHGAVFNLDKVRIARNNEVGAIAKVGDFSPYGNGSICRNRKATPIFNFTFTN